MMCSFVRLRKVAKAGLLGLSFLFSLALQAQDDGFKAVPILTGSTAYFTRVTAGQYQDAPTVSPLLLLPLGDKWLVEAKGSYSDTFSKNAQGDYTGTISYGMAYGQIDYIANRYMTFVAGRFTTPFNIYGERLVPNWIRALQTSPLTSPVTSGSSLGGMMRGGFPGTDSLNVTYALYFSANNTHHLLATDRSTGGRLGFFLPRQRLEGGGSFQQALQAARPHSSGVFMEGQADPPPLTVPSEYLRSSGTKGSAYLIESVYRPILIPALPRLERVGRAGAFL